MGRVIESLRAEDANIDPWISKPADKGSGGSAEEIFLELWSDLDVRNLFDVLEPDPLYLHTLCKGEVFKYFRVP